MIRGTLSEVLQGKRCDNFVVDFLTRSASGGQKVKDQVPLKEGEDRFRNLEI